MRLTGGKVSKHFVAFNKSSHTPARPVNLSLLDFSSLAALVGADWRDRHRSPKRKREIGRTYLFERAVCGLLAASHRSPLEVLETFGQLVEQLDPGIDAFV